MANAKMKENTTGMLQDASKHYSPESVFTALKELVHTEKFTESVDISLKLGIDARKMMVRGSVSMPSGLGKTFKVAVFADGDDAKNATDAGADSVGLEDLVDEIANKEWQGYDVIIATPSAMPKIAKLARKLGPKGLMPNPKLGTVTKDVKTAVEKAKAGQGKFKIDKASIIHMSIGNVSFTPKMLKDNLDAVLQAVKKLKPASAKGKYLEKLSISTTMSRRSVLVDLTEYR